LYVYRLYAQLTSAFCKTGRIASGPGLLYVLHEIFCGFTQDNLKGASKDYHNQCPSHVQKLLKKIGAD